MLCLGVLQKLASYLLQCLAFILTWKSCIQKDMADKERKQSFTLFHSPNKMIATSSGLWKTGKRNNVKQVSKAIVTNIVCHGLPKERHCRGKIGQVYDNV